MSAAGWENGTCNTKKLLNFMAETSIERVPYGGWPNCYRVSKGEIEIIATSDIGPRIMRCGFAGGQNLFVEMKDEMGKSGEDYWVPRGGHRLWIAPELVPETYALDNASVEAKAQGDILTLAQQIEPETGLQKEISIALDSAADITVTHRISNAGLKSVRVAPWALTQMAQGGLAIVPFPPRGGHDQVLAPTNPLVMWAYTDFTDERWKFLKRYLLLKQNPENIYPQKAGLFREDTVCAYLLGDELFIKRVRAQSDMPYPDFGTSAQFFVNGDFLELETLGPLVDLPPGASVTHIENWSIHKGIALDSVDDDELDRVLLPLLS
jgi:hypothetical protein